MRNVKNGNENEILSVEFVGEPITMSAVVGWKMDGTNVYEDVTVTSFELHSASAVIEHERDSAVEFSSFDSPMYVVMKDGSRVKFQETSGSIGITKFRLEEIIDLSQVDYVQLADGTRLEAPQT